MGFFDSDLCYPTYKTEAQKHKRRRLVQGPNSCFMEVKCPGCGGRNIIYSHATTTVTCKHCKNQRVLTKPTGGKVLLPNKVSFRFLKNSGN